MWSRDERRETTGIVQKENAISRQTDENEVLRERIMGYWLLSKQSNGNQRDNSKYPYA